MQVQVQKLTRTTFPCSSAGPSGSELSHPVAPSREGMCTRWNRLIQVSAQRAERSPHLGRKELRLLPRREVTAFVDLVVVGEVGVADLGPAARVLPDLARERG